MSEPHRFVKKSLQQQLEANGIPSSLSPESKRITVAGMPCGGCKGRCRGLQPWCNTPLSEKKRQEYLSCLTKFNWDSNLYKWRNLSILKTLIVCGISSQMHWSVFLPTRHMLSDLKNFELRQIAVLRRSFTEVPIELHNCAREVDPINLSRQQWKVLLPTLQDHFPSVPSKFYKLLIKLSLGLGFLTKRLCGIYTHIGTAIVRRVLTSRLVRSKYARDLRLYFWEKQVNEPFWLEIFFPPPPNSC